MSQSLSASLDGQTPPQSRVEANFVSFADELHVKVALASFHDGDEDDNAHFSLFLKLVLYYRTSYLPEYYCWNAAAIDVVLRVPARHSTGEEFWEGFGSVTLWQPPALR